MSTSYGQSLSSLDAGLREMTLFTTHDVLTVTLVARELGCSRATSYRILNTLRNRDIVMLGPGGRGYYPGPALVELSRPRGLDQADRARLRPVIEEAVSLTAETVHVAALIGTQVLFFDGQEPDRAVRASLRPGYLRPAHAISAGKLLLSQFTDELPRYVARHRVPAGLTGWAQIHGLRGDTSIEDRARFDNYYIENWSLWVDLKIVLRTVSAVLRRSGG